MSAALKVAEELNRYITELGQELQGQDMVSGIVPQHLIPKVDGREIS